VTTAFVTLQREPPLTRILAPGRRAPSSSTTDRVALNRLAKIAVARPAAPAPTMATSHEGGRPVIQRPGHPAAPDYAACAREFAAAASPRSVVVGERVTRRYFDDGETAGSLAGSSERVPHATQRRNVV
jgi:hypothetical protein